MGSRASRPPFVRAGAEQRQNRSRQRKQRERDKSPLPRRRGVLRLFAPARSRFKRGVQGGQYADKKASAGRGGL